MLNFSIKKKLVKLQLQNFDKVMGDNCKIVFKKCLAFFILLTLLIYINIVRNISNRTCKHQEIKKRKLVKLSFILRCIFESFKYKITDF